MAKRLQLRRGTTAQNEAFIGALGELTYDTDKKQLRVHDGITVGGNAVDNTTRDVTSQVSNATETIAGKAKIATTAIAQAGVNDTDIITAKKLRDALNATGDAPIHACRGLLTFNGIGGANILRSNNIEKLTRLSTARYSVVFINPMPSDNYIVVGSAANPYTGGKEMYGVSLQTTAPTVNGFEFYTGVATGLGESHRVSIAIFGG